MSMFTSYTVNNEGKLTASTEGNMFSPIIKTVRAPLDVFLKESGDRYVTERAAAVQSIVGAGLGVVAMIAHNTYQRNNGQRAIAF